MPEEELTAFGQLMREGMRKTGLSQGRLGGLISDFRHGPVFDASGIRLIMQGKRRLDRDLVAKIIDTLDLDPLPAWEAAGLWPPGISADDLSELRAARLTAATRAASREGATVAAAPFTSDQAIEAKRTWRELAGQAVPPKVAA